MKASNLSHKGDYMKKQSLKCRAGQGLSEYMILVMLIGVCSIAASKTVGITIKSKLENINQKLEEIHI